MAEAFVGCHALQRIPLQTPAYQIDELWIRQLSQLFHDVFDPVILFLVCDDLEWRWHSGVICFELLKEVLARRSTEHARIWHANHIDDQLNLLAFIRTREKREARKQFNHDASEGPHVNLLRVREDAEHDIWCPIKPTLDVGVDDFILEAAAAKVSNCDTTLVLLFHENVLWL